MSISQGHSAQILAFPAKLPSPIHQGPRTGRLPRGVVSLRRVRAAQAREALNAEEAHELACVLLERAEAYLYKVLQLRGELGGES